MATANLPATINGRSTGLQRSGDIVRTLDDVFRLADVLVRSGMLPRDIRTPEAAAAIMLKGRELGIGAMEAFAGITVIQGKPTVSPQLMLSLINRSGLLADMGIEDDGSACTVTMTRRGRKPHREAFSMLDAKGMQLASKDNWQKQPKIMRKWRAVAACARIVFPDVIAGLYSHEEMGAEVDDDGEIVTVEADDVHEEALPEKPEPPPSNASGYGRTQAYAPPDEATACEKWVDAFAENGNTEWLDAHMDRRTGEVKPGVKDLWSKYQLANHLLKFYRGHADPAKRIATQDDEKLSVGKVYKLLAVAFGRDREGFEAEAQRYFEAEWVAVEQALKAPKPSAAKTPAPIGDDDGDPPAPWDADTTGDEDGQYAGD